MVKLILLSASPRVKCLLENEADNLEQMKIAFSDASGDRCDVVVVVDVAIVSDGAENFSPAGKKCRLRKTARNLKSHQTKQI